MHSITGTIQGQLILDHIREMPEEEARRQLAAFPGFDCMSAAGTCGLIGLLTRYRRRNDGWRWRGGAARAGWWLGWWLSVLCWSLSFLTSRHRWNAISLQDCRVNVSFRLQKFRTGFRESALPRFVDPDRRSAIFVKLCLLVIDLPACNLDMSSSACNRKSSR